ncbi:hypothetical protein NC652_031474 [Populus alba x Populus x berolinensis]|nr:hypothetical protein NC652_031474 [Populus alba x Populus x berolinensis]
MELGTNSISFFISISPVEIAIKFVPLWCFEVRKALGSNWAVFSFEWLYFLMKTPGGNVNPPKFVAIVLYMCPVKALFSKFQKP